MALTVSSSLNQKTWDATVRVTGGHPHQLWGIGAVQQSAEGTQLTVDRVLIRDADERMVGYAQLLVRQENGSIHAEAQQAHVNKPTMVPAFMQKLADYAHDRFETESITLSVDTPAAEPLTQALTQRGWERQGAVETDAAGPKRLRVPLGAADTALSSRLSPSTLDRCRAGLKVSDVAVREITATSGGVRAVGLKTGQINHLLKDLGQDSLLLVAAQERPDEQPEALGYLWFVHTVNMAMLYRVGFTRKARDLGIDDALLLTGAVELQKRGVQRMDGGESSDKDVPTVVRELADRERTVLGTWRKESVPVQQVEAAPAPAEPKKRGLFGRKQKVQEPAPEPQKQPEPPQRVDEVRQQVSEDLGIETTGITPAQSHLALGGGQASSSLSGSNGQPGQNNTSLAAADQSPQVGAGAATGTRVADNPRTVADTDTATDSTPGTTAEARTVGQASTAHQARTADQASTANRPGTTNSTASEHETPNGHATLVGHQTLDGRQGTWEQEADAESTAAKPSTKISKREARKQRRARKRAGQAAASSTVQDNAAAQDSAQRDHEDETPTGEIDPVTPEGSDGPDGSSGPDDPQALEAAARRQETELSGQDATGPTGHDAIKSTGQDAAEPEAAEPESESVTQPDPRPEPETERADSPAVQERPHQDRQLDPASTSGPSSDPEPTNDVEQQPGADRSDQHVEGDTSRRSRGPLAFGKRVYAESLQAFRDAAGR